MSESERAMLMGDACAKAYGRSPKKSRVIHSQSIQAGIPARKMLDCLT